MIDHQPTVFFSKNCTPNLLDKIRRRVRYKPFPRIARSVPRAIRLRACCIDTINNLTPSTEKFNLHQYIIYNKES